MPKKPLTSALSGPALEMVANLFKALSEPSRLKLLVALEQGEKNVSELVAATGLTQANVSRHLQTLTEAGILARKKEGLTVIYSIAEPLIFELCDKVCGGIRKRLQEQANSFGSMR
jgi:ArsR family transcriptional regulator